MLSNRLIAGTRNVASLVFHPGEHIVSIEMDDGTYYVVDMAVCVMEPQESELTLRQALNSAMAQQAAALPKRRGRPPKKNGLVTPDA